nr:autotransporter domain-containing protein [uncultured Cohaesibacter sp.]
MNFLRTSSLLASSAIVSFSAMLQVPFAFADDSNIARWDGSGDGTTYNSHVNYEDDVFFGGKDVVIDGDYDVLAKDVAVAADINSTSGGGPRSVTVSGGATLTATATGNWYIMSIGYTSNPSETSTITITGDGTKLITNGKVALGTVSNADATLTISDGATWEANDDIEAGLGEGTTAHLNIDNATFTLASGRNLYIADDPGTTSYVTVTNSASATTDGNVYVGSWAGGTGHLDISGGSTFTANGIFAVGTVTGTRTAGGTGYLTVSGGSSLTLNGPSYIGKGGSTNGTATISGAGTTLTANGTLHVGYGGNGTVILSDGARINADSIAIADQAASTGTLIIGSKAGEDAATAGTLKANNVTFGSGTGGIVFNHTDTDYVFDADVEGAGSLDFYSGKTALTGDYSDYTGSASVNGGTMLVNTTFNQAISVEDGGTLGGTGTVSDVTLKSGSTIAPGNSMGALTVNGDLDFVAGSTYEVEVDKDGHSDKLVSTGTVTIDNGAKLSVRAENGTDNGLKYAENTDYTILSANALTGKFGTITENFAFLEASVSYGAKDATLTLTRTREFEEEAQNSNQRGVAKAVGSLKKGSKLYAAVAVLPEGEPDKAFTQLTGEQHSNIQTFQVSNAAVDRNAASQRLRSSMGGIGGSGDQVTYGFHGEEDNIPLSMTRSPQMWAQAFGMWGEAGATENTSRVTSQSKGFLVGMDAEVWRGWRTGVFAGYSQTTSKTVATNSQSDIDNYHVGVYTGTQWEAMSGLVDVNFGVSGIWHQVDTDRSVSFTGFTDNLNAQYDAATTQAFAELGYTYEFEQARIQPFAGATLIHQWTDGFTEKGGAAALSASSSDNALGMTSLGVRGDVLVGRFGGVEAALNGSAAWQHAVGDVDNSTNMRFASGGDVFSVSGTPIDRDAASVEAGLSFTRGTDLSFVATYQGTYSENARDHGFKTGFKVKF